MCLFVVVHKCRLLTVLCVKAPKGHLKSPYRICVVVCAGVLCVREYCVLSEVCGRLTLTYGLVSCTVHPLKVNKLCGALEISLLSATAEDRPTSWYLTSEEGTMDT